ncbi:MAG: hypothetical protein GVY15_08165 [Bacteroidetes bacterium]|jgi:hypothetical protein|nr:hypothetical protein [Bacteroidota bacterium]
MNPFEYLLPLVSIIVGLAIADLATSLHRLLRARRQVEWDWLPLATALLAVVLVLNVWWELYPAEAIEVYTVAEFFPVMAGLIVLFLINAAALPDQVPSEGIDLRAFYESNSPYLWLLFAVYFALAIALNISSRLPPILDDGRLGWKEAAELFTFQFPNLVFAGLFVGLARYRNRTFHVISVVGVLLVLTFAFSQLSIGGPR